MRFSILVHGHQPPDNYDWVFHEAIEKAYAPFFALLDEFRWLRVSVHFSGSLLEWIERNNPAFIDWMRTLVERGQVELVTAGLYEPVLALIPPHDRANQILAHRAYLRRLFGADTTIAWLTERVWQQPIVEDLVAAGITAVPLDDGHFLAAGVSPETLTEPFLTEHQGSVLTLVPGLQDIRFAIPFIPVEDAVNLVERHADEGVELLTFADDIEKLGLWPGTFETVHTNGWLRRFLHGLDALDSVEVVPLGEALAALRKPSRRVYPPDGSYPEMLRWSLPREAQLRWNEVREDLERAEVWDEAQPFMRAGAYSQYLAKYPEVNWFHKRMLDVSRRVAARHSAASVRRNLDDLPEAVRELWLAQANCPYWHGWFGGAYLPLLRQTVYRHLLRAERALEAAGERRQSMRVFDLDADGVDEVLLTSDTLVVGVDPSEGGAAVEISDRVRAIGLVDTMARHPEAYHGTDGEVPYPYDAGRRTCFVDRFLAPGVPPARSRDIEDLGEFADAPYTMTTRRRGDTSKVTLVREAAAPGGLVRVEKTLVLEDGASGIEARYRLTGVEGQVRARFGVEFNFGIYFPEELRGNVETGERSLSLERGSAVRGVDGFALTLEDPAVRLDVAWSAPADLDVRPLTTVSRSESGLESNPQCLTCLPTWPIALAPGETFEVTLTLTVGALAAASE